MILIDSILNLGGIPITDWIQAAGAFIGIIAAFYGFYKLFRKNEELQSQITSLKLISEQSENQSRSLAEQVEQMIEANKIQLDSYELLKLYFSASIEAKEFNKKEAELRKIQEKHLNKPKLEWNGSMHLTDRVELRLKNNGEIANIVEFVELSKNTTNHNIKSIIGQSVEKKEDIKILFTAKPFGLVPRECYVDIQLIIQDKFGNEYTQILEGPTERIKVEAPIEKI